MNHLFYVRAVRYYYLPTNRSCFPGSESWIIIICLWNDVDGSFAFLRAKPNLIILRDLDLWRAPHGVMCHGSIAFLPPPPDFSLPHLYLPAMGPDPCTSGQIRVRMFDFLFLVPPCSSPARFARTSTTQDCVRAATLG